MLINSLAADLELDHLVVTICFVLLLAEHMFDYFVLEVMHLEQEQHYCRVRIRML
jgi:hypothetical protein